MDQSALPRGANFCRKKRNWKQRTLKTKTDQITDIYVAGSLWLVIASGWLPSCAVLQFSIPFSFQVLNSWIKFRVLWRYSFLGQSHPWDEREIITTIIHPLSLTLSSRPAFSIFKKENLQNTCRHHSYFFFNFISHSLERRKDAVNVSNRPPE